MKKLNNSYLWFGVFAFCFFIFQYISDYLRPNYNGNNEIFKYFLSIAPNFFPAIGIPSLFMNIFPYLNDNNDLFNKYRHLTGNLTSLSGLILWEFAQGASKKMYFDWNDILWTLFRAIVFQLIWIVTPRTLKEIESHTK